MKKTLYAWLTAFLLVPFSVNAAEFHATTGFSYQSWSSDEDESGSQLLIPISMDGLQERFSWHVNAGYASTKGDLANGSEGSVNGFLDSQVGAAYTLENAGGADWLAGIDFNLPTGKTGLNENDLRAMIDPDLVSVISPGQGFNVNPYLSVARTWDPWTVGLGVGYAFQGKYDYSDQSENYDPGDIFNAALEIKYAVSSVWNLQLRGQYATFTADKLDGDDLLQKGDILLIGATVQGEEWVSQIQGQYTLSPKTKFIAGLSYLYLAANDYESSSAYYMGRREKVTLSLGAVQELSKTLNLECNLAGFNMKDDPNWLHPDEDRTYQGWSVTAAVTKSF
jgi:hypothetical protein